MCWGSCLTGRVRGRGESAVAVREGDEFMERIDQIAAIPPIQMNQQQFIRVEGRKITLRDRQAIENLAAGEKLLL